MPRGKPHSPETKAAVMAALLTGQSISEVARQFKLDRKTVRTWKERAGIVDSPESPLVPQEKKIELGDLIVGYLTEIITTLTAQARTFRDEQWVKGQDASEVAVLHGVLADKALRILSALEPAGEGDGGNGAD